MNFGELKNWLQNNKIVEIECMIPDIAGTARGKIVPAKKYLKEENIRLPESLFGQTVTGDWPEDEDYLDIIDPAEIDMNVEPDPSTIRIVPWANEPTAQIIHDCYYNDGSPVELAPRNVLKRILKLYEDKGWTPVVAPELEFFLTEINRDPDIPLTPPTGRSGRKETARKSYGIDALNEFDPFFEQLYDFSESQQLSIDTLIHEDGAAQMEINFEHGNALDLCDQVFLFKRTVRETAHLHDCMATFMAKPMQNEPGSSMHVHQSIITLDTGKNIFTNEAGEASDLFYWYLGGQQKYMKAAIPFFAPNVNSYRRLTPDSSAPINAHWGEDNRTVGLRIPVSDGANRRIENRLCGADVNPYIAVATMLATGYLGMKNKIEPSEKITGSAYDLPHGLPRTIEEGFRILDDCEELQEILGERFVMAYKAVKMAEYVEFQKVISSWEREFLMLNV